MISTRKIKQREMGKIISTRLIKPEKVRNDKYKTYQIGESSNDKYKTFQLGRAWNDMYRLIKP